MKRFLSIFCAAFFFISALTFPVTIHAETSTYVEIKSGECFITGASWSYNYKFANDCRAVYISRGVNNSGTLYFVVPGFNTYQEFYSTACTGSSGGNAFTNNLGTYGGVTYRAHSINIYYSSDLKINCPIVLENPSNSYNAYYYTYGAGAVAPTEPINWGLLANVGFRSKIAGSGQAAVNNVDVISWNPDADTAGNVFTEDCKVQIRAVPGRYEGSSRTHLIDKVYTDFILDNTNLTLLGEYPVSQGSISYSWSSIINKLNLPFVSISSLLDKNGTWEKKGWIYQYRLVADDYEGTWRNIYTLTSSGVKNDIKVINITNIDQEVIEFVTDIIDIDVDVEVVIIYEDIIIPPLPPTPTPDPSATPSPVIPDSDNIPWWVYLLNAILDLIRSISEGIASIITSIINAVSDIINGILNLFRIDNFQIPDIELHMHEIGNNNILGFPGLVVNGLPGIMSALPTNSFIIHFPGINLMNVQLIQEMYIDLEEYLTALGISHEFMYTCTDGTVYTCLAWLLGRRLIYWLRR